MKRLDRSGDPSRIALVFEDHCLAMQGVACHLCQARCSAAAIRFRNFLGGYARPEVLDELCDGCGLCVPACPAGAMAMKTTRRA